MFKWPPSGQGERGVGVSEKKVYFGSWSNHEEMGNSWFERYDYEADEYKAVVPASFPAGEEVLFASYGRQDYTGDALVLYRKGGKLYEAHGSHCSCYGLEDQWAPEETTVEALAMRERRSEENEYWCFMNDHEEGAQVAYWVIVDRMASELAEPEGVAH